MLIGVLVGLAVLGSVLAVVRWTCRPEGWRAAGHAASVRSGPARAGPAVPQCSARRSGLGASRGRLALRPLPPALRTRFAGTWRAAEAGLASAPGDALRQLDELAMEVMRRRGLPVETFEHDVGEIRLLAPEVVTDYRAAHLVALAGELASDRDRCIAALHYHALLEGLLGAASTC
jgi:hypothetical protein